MEYVRTFCFDHGLYADADSKDFVGIAFPNGSVIGNPDNTKLRFDATFMKMAADGRPIVPCHRRRRPKSLRRTRFISSHLPGLLSAW